MTRAEIALALRIGHLINGVIAHRVGQAMGQIKWDAQPKNADVRQLNELLSGLAQAAPKAEASAKSAGELSAGGVS